MASPKKFKMVYSLPTGFTHRYVKFNTAMPDTKYSVSLEFDFGAGYWSITDKTTTGCRMNWSTAVPATPQTVTVYVYYDEGREV